MAKDWDSIMDNIVDLLDAEGLVLSEKIALVDRLLDRLQDEEGEI